MNAIARAASRAQRRVGFSNTLFDHCQNIPARRRTRALEQLYFLNFYIFAARRALVVALVCGQSRDFCICRRVLRRVPNRDRVVVF